MQTTVFWTCVGWAGIVHDARVFVHSPLYTWITVEKLLPNKTMTVNRTNIPLFLVGDSAYPLHTWSFPHNGILTQQQKDIQL